MRSGLWPPLDARTARHSPPSLERMSTRLRVTLGCLGGVAAFLIAQILADRAFWMECGGRPIHSWPDIFVCWHIMEITVVCSLTGGFFTGLLSQRRGLVLGVVVAAIGFLLFWRLVRYPFGTDHLFALQWGLLLYVVPTTVACVIGARVRGGSWRNAL